MSTTDVSKSPRAAEEAVREKARELGFDSVGFARADVPLDVEFERYRAFLDAGMHGAMGYLADHAEVRRRLDTQNVLEGARSVVCLARDYRRDAEDEARDPSTARLIARYARGRDYHNVVRRKLRKLAAFVRTLGTPSQPVQARPLCDDAPILERVWATRAGLGFVGKNGLLIVPGKGSYVLLGEVVTTLELEPGAPMSERCGSCTRCLDACPTHAFERPFVLDPRRCISYLTIELRDAIPAEQRVDVGEHLFGCDDCQTVCPFNASSHPRDASTRRAFEPLERWSDQTLASFLALDEDRWREVSEGSPVRRATRDGLARNAAIVLGNQRESDAAPALRSAAEAHPSPMVREAAAWALSRMTW